MYNSDNRPVYGMPAVTDLDRYYSLPPFLKTSDDLRKTDRKINRWPLFIGLILLLAALLSGAGNLIQLDRVDTVTDAMQVAYACLIAFNVFISLTAAITFICHSRDIPFITALPLIAGTVVSLISAMRTMSTLSEQGARAAVFQQLILNVIVPIAMTVFYSIITLARPKSRIPSIVFCVLQVVRAVLTGSSILTYLRFIGTDSIYLSVIFLSISGALSCIMYGIAALFVRPKYRKDAFIF